MTKKFLEQSSKTTADYYKHMFMKHYLNKTLLTLTKEDVHVMDCFGLWGMTEWVIDNIKQ